jgi:hypothetical protein
LEGLGEGLGRKVGWRFRIRGDQEGDEMLGGEWDWCLRLREIRGGVMLGVGLLFGLLFYGDFLDQQLFLDARNRLG